MSDANYDKHWETSSNVAWSLSVDYHGKAKTGFLSKRYDLLINL
jgi:hypothetical protein